MDQNAFGQSNSRINEIVNNEIYFRHADKHRFLQVDTIILGVHGLAYPK